jgi:hypothetical protein
LPAIWQLTGFVWRTLSGSGQRFPQSATSARWQAGESPHKGLRINDVQRLAEWRGTCNWVLSNGYLSP